MFWEMIAVAEETKQDLAILLLDFEKAYDRVDCNFLYEVMGRIGIPCNYIKAILHYILQHLVEFLLVEH
mgnify:CR=1 FL=1